MKGLSITPDYIAAVLIIINDMLLFLIDNKVKYKSPDKDVDS